MTDLSLAQDGRVRHWLLDAALGGIVALAAITLAHAARPEAPAPLAQASPPAPVQAAPSPEEPPILIAFQDPVPGRVVVSPFGLRQLPWEEGGRLHAGVDIQAESGEAVRAAADGVVVEAGQSSTYGRYVALKHAEGLTSFYAHLGAVSGHLRRGMAIKAGEAVGKIGSSGVSTGPHLHFEIRDSRDRPLNPTLFLGREFAEAGDLPLRKAQRFARTVRIAQVSTIPQSKRALMEAKLEKQEMAKAVRLAEKSGKAPPAVAADAAGAARDAVAVERFEGLKVLPSGDDGRPRAQITS
ncbi:M23 family metallopeptidase [Phenylobacterium sp. J426]|uniref:M23 family metallopeptidase n=1 Tax=Phenylobacterium sp. J426 TaxID=2898439 RepID=UPI002150E3FD|nr:M23 family metallopeptidase [Phenylobacterium sp. J426]MCR5874431.1 M23 family metallopeptidase [Phenylobacterium sp. J426]